MALVKEITQEDGVPTSYHRVATLTIDVGNSNVIEVQSYVSAEGRASEKAAVARGEKSRAYTRALYVAAPYDPSMGVEGAYEFVASLEEFAGAESDEVEP